MARIDDQRLLEIHLYGRTAGMPAHDCVVVRRKLVMLLAAPRWTDIELVGDVFPLNSGRIAMMINPDWGISFNWREGEGAFELQLEP